MSVQSLSCPSCGGPITVPEDLEYFNCAYCGVGLNVKHGEGYVALRLAKEIGQAIRDTGSQTQDTIRAGTHTTQSELKRLQLAQTVSSAQLQLSAIQAEIRALERSKKNRRVKQQLKQLYAQEQQVIQLIRSTQAALVPVNVTASTKATTKQVARRRKTPSRFSKGCLWGFLVYMGVGVFCALLAMPVDRIVFSNSASSDGSMGPLGFAGALVGFLAGVLVFFYHQNPNAALWKSVNELVSRTPLAPLTKKAEVTSGNSSSATSDDGSQQAKVPHDESEATPTDESSGT